MGIHHISRRLFLQIMALTGLSSEIDLVSAAAIKARPLPRSLQAFPAFLDTLIPADESPSASQLELDRLLLRVFGRKKKTSQMLVDGCRWLDEQARERGMLNFSSATMPIQQAIVTLAEGLPVGSKARTFFDTSLKEVMTAYYARPESWPGLGFDGPPQPQGFMDHQLPPCQDKA